MIINPYSFIEAGRVWLANNAIYYDFSRLEAATGVAIGASDTGIDDVGINHVDGTPLNGIVASNIIVNNKPVGCIVDSNDDAIDIGRPAALKTFFRQTQFDVLILLHCVDGRIAASYNLMGVLSTGAGYFNVFVETDGRLDVGYATNVATNVVNWKSTNPVVSDNETTVMSLIFRLNFDADTITVFKDGSSVAGSINSGTISSINSSLWDTSQNFYIGALNNAGTITNTANATRIIRVAFVNGVTPDYVGVYFNTPVYDALWSSQFHVTTANYAATRAAIKTAIFGTYPTNATPASTAAVVSGSIHGVTLASLSGYAAITRIIFNRSGTANRIYRIVNSAPNGRAFWYCLGHSPTNDALAINNFLSHGYDVFFGAMADTGDTEDLSDNTQSGADWTPSSGGNHNEMSALNVAGMSHHLYDKIEAMNYSDATFSYTSHYISGTSGGGWTAAWLGALDERWTKIFPIRGVKPRINKCYPSTYLTASDFEQGGSNGSTTGSGQAVYDFYTTYTYEDVLMLCATNSRLIKVVTHITDTALLGDSTFNVWTTLMQARCEAFGGQYKLFLNTAGGESNHTVYQDELDQIISEVP